jgi:hypothetical protein
VTTNPLIIRPNEQGKFILPISVHLLRELGRIMVDDSHGPQPNNKDKKDSPENEEE